MELDIIQTKTTWNDAAGSINSNYAKIADAIAQLKANGGGGGGGADIDLTDYATKVWVEAKGYITASALTLYLKTEDAEETYATKDFVDNKLVDYAPLTSVQGFENRIGGLEGAVPQLNDRVTTVESKVSSLNETVSTGENNLLDRVNVIEEEYATKTYVDNAIDGIDLSAYLLKADLTKSRIQSTLGISDWALAVTKPSYAWSEITSRPTALSQFTDDVVAGNYIRATVYGIGWDADSLYDASVHSGDISHLPSGLPYGVIYTLPYRKGFGNTKTDYAAQIFIPCGDDITSPNDMFFRTSLADSWNGWNKVITDKNIGNYKAGDSDKLGGYDISRFLLTTKRDYSSMDLNTIGDKQSIFTEIRTGEVTTSNCPISGYGALLSLKDGNSFAKMQIVSASGSADTYIRCVQGGVSTISANWRRIITDNNIGNYNAGSATKLKTRHKLWGNDFDGTEDVSGSLDVSGNIKASGNINASSITINGVTITASNGSITVNGNVFATGDITGGV